MSLIACGAVVATESMAYADLSTARLEGVVGIKGDCCVPGLKTACTSIAPYACTTQGIDCDEGHAFDTCDNPTCDDSDNRDDACGSDIYGQYSVSVTTCNVLSGGMVNCGTNGGTHCMYVTASATVEFLGCGQATICEETVGIACQ